MSAPQQVSNAQDSDYPFLRRKCFYPLESHPDVFTEVIHGLGVFKSLVFADVLSIDEPDILALTPRPAYALVLVFPCTPKYEKEKAADETDRVTYLGSGDAEDIFWLKQTIYNACGLYGILHAISNGPPRDLIEPGSLIAQLLEQCTPLGPRERALALEASAELEKVHTAAALKGDTAPPPTPESETECHYVCFVRSRKSNHLYLLDGDRKGPVDLGITLPAEEDMLSPNATAAVREWFEREAGEKINFNLLALVKDS